MTPTHVDLDFAVEPERYELFETAAGPILLNRRDVLRGLGAGLFVLCLLRESPSEAQESGRQGRRGQGGPVPREIGAWVHVAEDGAVSAFSGKAEVGQNARTSLALAVADELRLPVGSVEIVLGDTDRVPFDLGTFGSRTTPSMVPQIRRAAAAARTVLLDLAAERLGAGREALVVKDGTVSLPGSGKSVGFGELTGGKRLVQAIEDDQAITPPDDWTVAGRPTPKRDGRDFVTGAHKYASDVSRPGMLVGKVLRPPAFGAKNVEVVEFDLPEGARLIVDGDFHGVVAPDEPTAARVIRSVVAKWETPDDDATDANVFDAFRERLDAARGRGDSADVDAAMDRARARVDTKYTIAYIAHAPLEPRAAVAEWEGDRLTVWTGTQRPFGVRTELARAFDIPEERVRVIVPDTGAGYGGKHTGEAAVEAARLAKAAGKPVRVVWTREEEFTWAYFRPAGLIAVRAGADADGHLTAWEFHNVNSGGSGIEPPYEVGARRVQAHQADSPLRQGSYRALAATANHFARESAMDELARLLKLDPLEFRLRNLRDERMRGVLTAAAERFGWGKAGGGDGRGFGLACGTEKGGYVATCAEVAVEGRGVKVVRAVTAFECGAVINPTHLENQVMGALVQGLGGALFEAIRFGGGTIKNARFSRYRLPRFSDMPKVEVVLLDRKDLPSAGAGETPIVGIAPAVGNAIFDATGRRIRSLPMVPGGLPEAEPASS
jgi:isoquinoline 1-oxidoreductase